ncbi:MFS transporter [Deinococcus yavapaiensis]|uniref:Fucose permease n=1 Tax=Deinococcus yavapaiensis KR-236 TaxID=694435 RepID=A0A318S966_9DEIO|nr:MFS transporter [Deinococcus yavapaiensis]PYE55670.1 fucose permease [Deinococcus yavapaiensis KR-236]
MTAACVRATSLLFLLNGVMFSSWIVQVAEVKAKFGFTDLELSVALLAVVGGSVLALPLATRLTDRVSLARLALASALGGAAALALVAVAPSLAVLAGVLGAFGLFFGTLDLVLNAQGVRLEQQTSRALLSMLHGSYSLGCVVGALLGAWQLAFHVGMAAHLAAVAVAVATIAAVATRFLDGRLRDEATIGEASALPESANLVRRALWALGGLAFLAALIEGAAGDWAGVYVREHVADLGSVTALTFGAFAVTMTCGRGLGHVFENRFGRLAVGRFGAVVAASGLALALLVPRPLPVMLGFALLGLGVSVLAPLAFSAVGSLVGSNAAGALARVTALFYVGYLVGPPVIGAVAHASSIRLALVLVVACAVLAAILAFALGPRASRRPRWSNALE